MTAVDWEALRAQFEHDQVSWVTHQLAGAP